MKTDQLVQILHKLEKIKNQARHSKQKSRRLAVWQIIQKDRVLLGNGALIKKTQSSTIARLRFC